MCCLKAKQEQTFNPLNTLKIECIVSANMICLCVVMMELVLFN